MNPLRLVALLLIVGGAMCLIYGGFSYTQATHSTDIGPLHLALTERREVSIPVWVGAAALAGGVALLLLGSRKG